MTNGRALRNVNVSGWGVGGEQRRACQGGDEFSGRSRRRTRKRVVAWKPREGQVMARRASATEDKQQEGWNRP